MVDFSTNINNFFKQIDSFMEKVDSRKESTSQISSEELKNIFDDAMEDGTALKSEVATLFANAFINSPEAQTSIEDIEASFVEIFDEISNLDGNSAEFSQDEINLIVDYVKRTEEMNEEFNSRAENLNSSADNESDESTNSTLDDTRRADLEKELGFDLVMISDERVQRDDEGNAFVLVENWSNETKDNNCLERIIRNNYDLESMGIELYDENYLKLEKAVMDANLDIYGETGSNDRRNSTIHTGDKFILPGVGSIIDDVVEALEQSAEQKTNEKEEKVPVGSGSIDLENIDQQYKDLADELYNAVDGFGYTDNAKIAEIIDPDKYSSEEFVYIMKAYSDKYGESLVSAIADDFKYDVINASLSLELNKQYQETLGSALLEVANSGSVEAIALLKEELKVADAQNNTFFIEAVKNNASEEMKKTLFGSETSEMIEVKNSESANNSQGTNNVEILSMVDDIKNTIKNSHSKEKISLDGLNSDQILEFVSEYNKDGGSFISDVRNLYYSQNINYANNIYEDVVNSLLEKAQSGNQEAIDLLAKEFYNATVLDKLGGNEKFISQFISADDYLALGSIADKFSEISGGIDIYKAIDNVENLENSQKNQLKGNLKTSSNITLTNKEILEYAMTLNENKLPALLNNPQLTDEDISKIIVAYNKEHGGKSYDSFNQPFMKLIDSMDLDNSFGNQDSIIKRLAEVYVTSIDNGSLDLEQVFMLYQNSPFLNNNKSSEIIDSYVEYRKNLSIAVNDILAERDEKSWEFYNKIYSD